MVIAEVEIKIQKEIVGVMVRLLDDIDNLIELVPAHNKYEADKIKYSVLETLKDILDFNTVHK